MIIPKKMNLNLGPLALLLALSSSTGHLAFADILGSHPLPPPIVSSGTGIDPMFTFVFDIGGNTGFGSLNTDVLGGGAFWATSGSLTVTGGGAASTTWSLVSGGPGGFYASIFVGDNVIVPGGNPTLDVYGLIFKDDVADNYLNIWGNSQGNYTFYHTNGPQGAADGSFTLQPVPDGGVTLMLLGGVFIGLETLRRKFRV